MDAETKRKIIIDNYTNPFHKETKESGFLKANSANLSCIDNLNLFVKIKDNIIEDAYFDGEGCAISISSASIMLKNIIGKNIEDVKLYIQEFNNMINEKEYDESMLGDANSFDEIYKQGSRKTCAMLVYKGLSSILEKNNHGKKNIY